MLWGHLGKERADLVDEQTIEFLKLLRARIHSETGRRNVFRVILADSHAQINGVPASGYLETVRQKLERDGFEVANLSSYWKKWGLNRTKVLAHAEKVRLTNPRLELELLRGARFYRGGSPAGHLVYYAMRSLEKPHVTNEFSGHVFLTYNSPSYREILPDLPIGYIRARPGTSRPPWIPA